MKRKMISLAVTLLFLQAWLAVPAFAKTHDAPEKIRTEIMKLGTGPDVRVKVKLKDGTKVEGYIVDATDSQFVVENPKTGVQVPVAYSTVKQVRGNNLSSRVKILIGVGVALAFIFIVVPRALD